MTPGVADGLPTRKVGLNCHLSPITGFFSGSCPCDHPAPVRQSDRPYVGSQGVIGGGLGISRGIPVFGLDYTLPTAWIMGICAWIVSPSEHKEGGQRRNEPRLEGQIVPAGCVRPSWPSFPVGLKYQFFVCQNGACYTALVAMYQINHCESPVCLGFDFSGH